MKVRKLDRDSRPKELYVYGVRGKGAFPLDMLRYDMASPLTQRDVTALSPIHPVARGQSGLRTVVMVSYHPPTEARWRSFEWLVVDPDEARLPIGRVETEDR